MQVIRIHHPGDPPLIAFLMFGKEFIEQVRNGKPGEIRVTVEGDATPPAVIEVPGIVCDHCSQEILEDHPLCLTGVPSRVYCWDCHRIFNDPHLVRNEK